TVLALDRDRQWRWYPAKGGTSRLATGMTSADLLSRTAGRNVVGSSTDGKELFIWTGGDVPTRIDRLDIMTGRRPLLTEIAPADRTGLFSFTPTSVMKNGGQYGYSYAKRLST